MTNAKSDNPKRMADHKGWRLSELAHDTVIKTTMLRMNIELLGLSNHMMKWVSHNLN